MNAFVHALDTMGRISNPPFECYETPEITAPSLQDPSAPDELGHPTLQLS